MDVIDKAVDWAVGIANDNTHGYSQANRWGVDYDCSSLVISAWEQAGVPVKSKGASYTGNMLNVFLACGFKQVTDGTRMRGDVLLCHNNSFQHTAMVVDGGTVVQASQSENGGIYGQPGDQTGREINISPMYTPACGWDYVLRFIATASQPNRNDIYTVVAGDTLYSIAQRFGLTVYDLAKINAISDPSLIWVGQVLKLDQIDFEEETTECDSCKIELPNDDDDEIYTIVAGDTLSGIAYQRYGRWNYGYFIADYNGIPNAHKIMVGQKIKLPSVKKLLEGKI